MPIERYSKDYNADLDLMKLDNLHIYHSTGCGREARILGKVADDAYGYIASFFDEKPEIELLVLNKSDWEERVSPNQPYGNPFMPDNRVYYGVGPPESWIEPLTLLADGAPTELREELVSIAGPGPCTTREAVEKIFTLDLFSFTLVHELAHPFLAQKSRSSPADRVQILIQTRCVLARGVSAPVHNVFLLTKKRRTQLRKMVDVDEIGF